MGYMGLSHWAESDNAADFRVRVMNALKRKGGKAKVQQLIREEMKLVDNHYNTDGLVNVALVMEDAGGKNYGGLTPDISELMEKKDFKILTKGLQKQIADCENSDEWGDSQNRLWHKRHFERMLKFVKGKASKA